MVERHFGAIPAQRLPNAPTPAQTTPLAQRTQSLHNEGLREGVIMSFNVPSQATAPSAAHAYALCLIPELLTEGSASRLQRLMVQEQQVLQAISASYEPYRRGDSLMSLYAYSDPAKGTPQEAAQRLAEQIEALRQTAPNDNELKRAKARLLARHVFARDDIAKQAQVTGRIAAAGLDPALQDVEQQAIDAVTGEQVRQAAHDYLGENRRSTTLMHGEESPHE
jgi:zinc protease